MSRPVRIHLTDKELAHAVKAVEHARDLIESGRSSFICVALLRTPHRPTAMKLRKAINKSIDCSYSLEEYIAERYGSQYSGQGGAIRLRWLDAMGETFKAEMKKRGLT